MDKTNKELNKLPSKDLKEGSAKDAKEKSPRTIDVAPKVDKVRDAASKGTETGRVSAAKAVATPVKKEDKCCKSCDCMKLSRAEMKGLLSHLPAYSERDNVMSAKAKLLKALD